MIDLPNCETVEIAISTDRSRLGTRIWVHIDGELVLRIYRVGKLVIDDRRAPREEPPMTGRPQ